MSQKYKAKFWIPERGYIWCSIAFILGALLSLSLPPIYALPIMPISFAGFLLVVSRSRSIWIAMLRGWCFGFGHFLVAFHWIGAALLVDAERFGWLAVPAVVLIAAGLAFFLVFVSVAVWLSPNSIWRKIIILALAWTFSEWLRSILFTGFPMSPIGISWTISDAMIQSVSVFGVFGLSFVTVLASTFLLSGFFSVGSSKRMSVLLSVGISLCVLFIIWGGGEIRIYESDKEVSSLGIKIRIVQGNIPQKSKWTADTKRQSINKYVALSTQESQSPPLLVIWPETALPVYIANDEQILQLIGKAIPSDGFLITGAPRIEKELEQTKVWNSMYLIGSDYSVRAVYDKHHLVPFGEYIPLRRVLGFSNIVESAVDFSSGFGPETISVAPLPPFSPLICYEGIFPGNVIGEGLRPAWLLNLTNDGWFGDTTGPYQHFQTARLRALEEGLPLIRAANTGISAIIDPLGRIRQSVGLRSEGVIDGYLPSALKSPPPYAILGNWILVIVGIPILFLCLYPFRKPRLYLINKYK